MEPKKMFLDSFCKKGLYIESFGRPSPLYPSLTPGSMHTLQCERCCVHPWVKFEKKTVEINSKNKQHNLWFSSRPATFEGFFFLEFPTWWKSMKILFFWCFRKICCWKTGTKGSIYWRVAISATGFLYAQLFHLFPFIEWSISKISGTYGK